MQKYFYLFFSLLFLLSCSHSKKITSATNPNILINDIWALESIRGKKVNRNSGNPRQKLPVLEVHIKEMNFYGNDGCNEISGKLEKLNQSDIKFTSLTSTKMACPQNETKDFVNLLLKTNTYRIERLHLLLFDENKNELMRFLKVD